MVLIDKDILTKIKKTKFTLSNRKASKECIELMNLFSKIYTKGVLSGQHCNKSSGSDFEYVKRITGKTPAILGFDLLSYSRETETIESDFECIDEIVNNRGSVDKAIILAKELNAIITLCWHWFSPMNGKGKSFYTENTTFNLNQALRKGTDENLALVNDLDKIAEELKKFRDNNIPILWRPLHEASGTWFWWGSEGAEIFKKLYRLMYDRYINQHDLNNLIWVWSSCDREWYPGDDVVDIQSIDCYSSLGNHEPLTEEYIKAISISEDIKPIALGENGPIPDPELLKQTKTYWLWFMTWNNSIKHSDWNDKETLAKFYNNPYVINLEDLSKFRKGETLEDE